MTLLFFSASWYLLTDISNIAGIAINLFCSAALLLCGGGYLGINIINFADIFPDVSQHVIRFQSNSDGIIKGSE